MPTSNGREQVFNDGIRNNDSRVADTTAEYVVTVDADGTYGKIDPNDLPSGGGGSATLQEVIDNGASATKGAVSAMAFMTGTDPGITSYINHDNGLSGSSQSLSDFTINPTSITNKVSSSAGNNESKITLESDNIAIELKNGLNKTTLNFEDPTNVSIINVPAPATPGTYTLATTDYFLKQIKIVPETTYTLLSSDTDKILHFTSSTAVTLTVPTGLVANGRYEGKQIGDGQISFVQDGTLLHKGLSNNLKTAQKYSPFAIDFEATETYIVYGELELV